MEKQGAPRCCWDIVEACVEACSLSRAHLAG
jgi:hypothetical protein